MKLVSKKYLKIFLNETIKTFPDFLVKRLQEFHNLYRASRYQVFDNYKYIMPDPHIVMIIGGMMTE